MNENETSETPEAATPPALPQKRDRLRYEAMPGGTGFAAVIDALLKKPGSLLFEWEEGRGGAVLKHLMLIASGSFLIFGFLLGMFSGGDQLWAVPTKVFAGAFLSALITLPSLYVFSSLGGFDFTLKKATGLLLCGLTLIGVILIGLAPVLWIFTQSTDSLGFMGFLVLAFWIAALCFGIGMITRGARAFGDHSTAYLTFWSIIFVVVTLQMSTSLRPLLGPAEETLLPTEKRFFLEHWGRVFQSRYD
ncbi:MAG: hypothetical protein P1U58_06285 [Verrucomicrobiales bacterium]|nr:hypothetical protein [Verrucomicrobiales bacterium]